MYLKCCMDVVTHKCPTVIGLPTNMKAGQSFV